MKTDNNFFTLLLFALAIAGFTCFYIVQSENEALIKENYVLKAKVDRHEH